MKSSINVRYNVYAPKAERNRLTHLNRSVSFRFFFCLFFFSSSKADAFTRDETVTASTKQRCEIQYEALHS